MAASFNVLSVCGSGTVTSSMVAASLKENLEEKNIRISTTEARPMEALQLVEGGNFDFIIFTSPLPAGDYSIPVINATGLLTGIGEEEFMEEVLETISKIKK
ncbi:PTS fructose transporter subunit IIB [Alkalibaculum sp. M08DMB]|uniref:PTS fructose transporter subunit IIB n=1 Tax=Alkalibaculum sporogenes TaxID=2655001 RepID=A0A6A7K7A2_9FIRM|nr:PTS fructose transporter subunit IIB [Alkalibaculum sporogenes]MPW25369.1 PTS fructose transporter subunit IIB [Alkalibaculum sporogenes]